MQRELGWIGLLLLGFCLGCGSEDASNAGTGGVAGMPATPPTPTKLSETGLYSDLANETLTHGVERYHPTHELWSDGATKQRWVWLPPGSQIDTSDMNYWVYPVGTKLWKEFSRDGKRVETRLLQKNGEGDWYMVAFHWNDAQTDADAVPAGLENASGTPHDIPNQNACENCHGKTKDHALGFSAIQLSHSQSDELTLSSLAERLTLPAGGDFTLPGNDVERAALGYLHANCGHCHNENSFLWATVPMQLWLKVAELGGDVTSTSTYVTTVNQPTTGFTPTGTTLRIAPGAPNESDVHVRMGQRGTLFQMPPVGTEDVDATGAAAVDAWITSL